MKEILYGFNLLFLAYFLLINGFYILLMILAARVVRRYRNVAAMTEYEGIFETTFYKPVTVLVPAHNEEATIVHTVLSALAVRYPELEVVVINDGSADSTMDVLIDSFDLIPSTSTVSQELPCKPIRGVYESPTYPGLLVVDKEQGGKADALNAGINASSFPLVCNIDADSMIDMRAMVQITRPFLEDHRVVAIGGVVVPANDCDIERGDVKQMRLARNDLARFQTVEYLRAFLFGRIGWSGLSSLMIISGAFAVFRREALIEVGGYRTDTVGEDMELVLRMHRMYSDKKKDYRVIFLPDPICYTQLPEDIRSLAKQRRRWQRGLAESLSKNWKLCCNPKYGRVGMIGYPFFALFELLSPVVEVSGYLIVVVAILMDAVNWEVGLAILACATLLGTITSVSALLLEARTFNRYSRLRDTLILVGYAVLECFGYRQLHALWRFRGVVDHVMRKGSSWGQPARKAF